MYVIEPIGTFIRPPMGRAFILPLTDLVFVFSIILTKFESWVCKDTNYVCIYKHWGKFFCVSTKIFLAMVMTKEEKLRYLNSSMYALRAQGVIKTQAEFAKLVGINPTSLSAAKAARPDYLTDQLMYRIKEVMEQYGEIPQKPEDEGVFIPSKTLEMYTAMATSLDRLTRILERYFDNGEAVATKGA